MTIEDQIDLQALVEQALEGEPQSHIDAYCEFLDDRFRAMVRGSYNTWRFNRRYELAHGPRNG